MYDYLIVGSGLFGSVFAREMTDKGKKCLVIDKRSHLGGNIHCERVDEINIHSYGPHIFHTNDKRIWDYVNRFVDFNRFTYSPLSFANGKHYNLPFNMNTFHQMWNVVNPSEAMRIVNSQSKEIDGVPKNLEEQAIKFVGRDIYETLIKGYTEKQWGRKCSELPSFIIKRLPVRFTFDNNYFDDKYQGIPIGGYNKLTQALLKDIDIILNVDFLKERNHFDSKADYIIYTGEIDRYYDYCFGELEYRSLKFEHERLDVPNYQGVACINYADSSVPFTRIVEHKHFENIVSPTTIITREYPQKWNRLSEPYYPINDPINNKKYNEYKNLAMKEKNVFFGGRLAEYKYYDMHQVIASSLKLVKNLTHEE